MLTSLNISAMYISKLKCHKMNNLEYFIAKFGKKPLGKKKVI